jgi:hypothetical protein
MKRIFLALSFMLLMLLVGLAMAQSRPMNFEETARIGQPRPRGLQYDPNFDRLVWVDVLGRLQLVDAKTFAVQHTLYDTGFYNAYAFSHNGKYLALAIDLRLEIWDANTGTMLVAFPPDGALRVEAPLYWSLDDTLVSVNTQVRAPQELRRSENDTTNLPWVWDVASELGERRTILPNARAIPFFDYRNGFVYGANNIAVAGIAERLRVLDITPNGVNLIAEIPANRFEPDPMFAWMSLREDYIYVRPDEFSSSLVQIDTATGNLVTLDIGREYTGGNMGGIHGLQLSRFTRIIGNPLDTQDNSLMRFFFGSDYRSQFNFHPITVTLVDFLTPATQHSGTQIVALLYIFDETRGVGRFEFVDFYSATGFDVAPDGNSVVVRRSEYPERIEIYDLQTGNMTQSFLPAMPEVARDGILKFDGTGSVVISDYQRFDVATGAVLFENLHYNFGFDIFYWNDDNETLLTATGNRLWEWDIATGEVIRRETLRLGEMVVGTSSDGERYLVAMSNSTNDLGVTRTYEMVEIGMEERTRVTFQDLQDVQIEQVIYSPNGRNFLVIYSTFSYDQHAPGNQVMVYNLDEGALWHLAGDDMPYMTARSYGWIDDQTFYIYSEEGSRAPERIYGLNYHPSGIPQCLADEFPEKISEWGLVWERLNERLDSDGLHRLSRATCALLPLSEQRLTDYIFPSPTPTRLPVTATPSTIAGVPLCLTSRFSTEARDYAVIWQELTEGLSEEQVAETEKLLCENLTGGSSPQYEPALVTNNIQVMIMDIQTGVRSVGSYIPAWEQILPPNIELVNEAFRLQFGRYPDGRLSHDVQHFAVRNQTNQITIYNLLNPYTALSAAATATSDFFIAQSSPEAGMLSLRPTATQGFTHLGQPRPTLTPTVTPTAPAIPEGDSYLAQMGQVEEVCPYTELFTVDNPPPDYAATGRIIARRLDNIGVSGVQGNHFPWLLEPETGEFTLKDDLPVCHAQNNCSPSFDAQWMVYRDEIGDFILSRPDGSQAQMLFTAQELAAEMFGSFDWLGLHTLRYRSNLDEDAVDARAPYEINLLDVETGVITEPLDSRQPDYNDLATGNITAQPGVVNRYNVVQTRFNAGRGDGFRYFIYDRQDEEFIYFSRLGEYPPQEMIFSWHPLGTVLYYAYPDNPIWYAFLPESETFVVVGEDLPGGGWSNDGRYRIDNYSMPFGEAEERIEDGLPVPSLQVWDSVTGASRLYCTPGLDGQSRDARIWSPDNRYWIFQSTLLNDNLYERPPYRTFVLDLQTGSVTEISQLASSIAMWMQEVYP